MEMNRGKSQRKISVIVPTFNRAHKILKSLHSVVAQDYSDWELIVIDDGSTDETESVVSHFREEHRDLSIFYFYQDNAGPSSARNSGVEKSAGDIIVYLDSDDCLYSSALSDIFWVLKDDAVLYGLPNHNRTLVLLDAGGSEISRKFDGSGMNLQVSLEDIYEWRVKTTSSGLFHRKSVFNQGIRWQSGFWIEDLEILLQMAVLAPHGFCHIPKALVDYVQVYGADGLCSNARYGDWAHAFESIYERHKNDPLMKNPHAYLDRIRKYKDLEARVLAGVEPPALYKYFPEHASLPS